MGLGIVERGRFFLCCDLQSNPCLVTAGKMVALRACFAALAFLGADQLLKLAMHLLDLPAHGALVLNVLRGDRSWRIAVRVVHGVSVGNHPFNVAIWCDNLEKTHEVRVVFELDNDAVFALFLRPNDVLQMDVSTLFAERHFPVAFERGHEVKSHAVDRFEVLHRGVPGIEENGARLDPLVADGANEHLTKVVVFGLAVVVRIEDAIVDGVVVSLGIGVQKVDHSDPAHQAVFGSAVLELNQLDLFGVPLILNAVVKHQERFGAVVQQGGNKLPETAGRQLFAPKVIADRIVARAG